MKVLIYTYPICGLVGFCKLYTWMNATKRLFVHYWGCGCPQLDGSHPFIDTNLFTIVLLALAATGTAIPYWTVRKRSPPEIRPCYLACLGAVIGTYV